MTLYIIGIGLADPRDITVKGLEIITRCDLVYLENYTSILQCSLSDLAGFYGRKIILASRGLAEEGADQIVAEAKDKEVAFLVIGDPFSATTHIELIKQAHYSGVKVEVVNNASILTAVGITGLQLYKFGKTTSIPFDQVNLETPYLVLKDNLSLGLHTLFLLDLKPEGNKFMTINQAIGILLAIEKKNKKQIITPNTLALGCARLGSKQFMVKAGKLKNLKTIDLGQPPQCLIIPGKLHFIEEEMLQLYS